VNAGGATGYQVDCPRMAGKSGVGFTLRRGGAPATAWLANIRSRCATLNGFFKVRMKAEKDLLLAEEDSIQFFNPGLTLFLDVIAWPDEI